MYQTHFIPAGEAGADAPALPLQRARGQGRVAFAARNGRTALSDLYQSGCLKLRLPAPVRGHLPEAVLINTAGGLTDGDIIDIDARWGEGGMAAVTTQAAERIYRSRGGLAHMRARLTVEAGACALWLPQETILFDRGRLRRSNRADLAPGARLLACESVVFGRTAMGETVTEGLVSDGWEIRIGGRLVLADRLRLDGDIAAGLARPAVAAGCRALATLIHAGEDAERIADALRAVPDDAHCMAAASCLGQVTVARFAAHSGQALRRALAAAITAAQAAMALPGGASPGVPRAWML